MRIVRFIVVTLLCGSIAIGQDTDNRKPQVIPPVTTFDPARQRMLSYSDEAVDVVLKVGKERDSLLISTRATGKETKVDLPEEMVQVNEIRGVVNSKLAVSGMVNGSGSEVAIVDLAQAKITDKFLCYNPSIAPDGRFIAFVKFYPAHFSEGTEDHYMVYDISKSPRENRPSSVSADDWKVVGDCIYPLGTGNEDFDNLRRPMGGEHESRSTFFWDSKDKFVFADQVEGLPTVTLVLVEMHSETKPTVRTIEQAEEEVCKKIPGTISKCALVVRGVHFKATMDASVVVTFEIVPRQRLVDREYVLSSFQ